MLPGYPLILASASADGAALTNSTTATSILPVTGVGVIPGSTLQVGSLVKVTITGRISTLVTSPGTITFDLRFGSVVVSSLGAMSLNATAQTNATFELTFLAVVRTIGTGTSATALVTAQFSSRATIGSGAAGTTGAYTQMLPETAPAVGTGFDSTAANAVQVFATWSVANAANSITVHQALVELKV